MSISLAVNVIPIKVFITGVAPAKTLSSKEVCASLVCRNVLTSTFEHVDGLMTVLGHAGPYLEPEYRIRAVPFTGASGGLTQIEANGN